MLHGRSILVVDDYADTREMLAFALETAGYGVLLAESGRDGIALAHAHHPVAVVMDIYMPEMDGIETTRHFKAQADLAGIPVLAHTAGPNGLAGVEDLFDGICAKPCSPDALIDLLNHMLQSKGHPS